MLADHTPIRPWDMGVDGALSAVTQPFKVQSLQQPTIGRPHQPHPTQCGGEGSDELVLLQLPLHPWVRVDIQPLSQSPNVVGQ